MMGELIQVLLFYLLVYFAINGLDELGVDARMVVVWMRQRWAGSRLRLPGMERMKRAPEQRIGILVPLWQEAAVIEAMVETNLRQVDYQNYDFFLGVYPNDRETLAAVTRLEARYPRVHVVVNRRPGPTSKADCLNHVFQEVARFESKHGADFPVLMLHDAEDLLHPASLRLVNWYAVRHGMVQVPVLPLPTPWTEWAHGVYCDEFAEFFQRDLAVRHAEGGFLPSNGVGTAFRRDCLEALAASQEGCLLDGDSLTEDYEIGLKLHQMGCKQILLPLTREYGETLATREFFPRSVRDAIRQRTRWISGQCLQSWERNGWPLRGSLSYWFWRDRKGLVGNFLNALALVLLALSVVATLAPEATGLGRWIWLAGSVPGAQVLFLACTMFSVERLAVRTVLVARIYGWGFAMGVAPRMLLSAVMNCVATARALRRYAAARWKRKRLSWLKTEHAFPIQSMQVASSQPVEQPALAMVAAAGAGAATVSVAAAGWAMLGGTPTELRGGTPTELRGGTPTELRGGTPTELRGGTPTEMRGGTPTEMRGGTPTELRGGTPSEPRNAPLTGQRGAPSEIPTRAHTVLLPDGSILVVLPQNLTPVERARLTRHATARLVFVEEQDQPMRGRLPGAMGHHDNSPGQNPGLLAD
jgi:adsorption protein B